MAEDSLGNGCEFSDGIALRSAGVRYLAAVGVEPLDGDRRAVGGPTGEPEDAPVDAPEAALADHEQRAEVARGAAELPQAEFPQAVCPPLLVQLRDALRRGAQARGLARRRPRV